MRASTSSHYRINHNRTQAQERGRAHCLDLRIYAELTPTVPHNMRRAVQSGLQGHETCTNSPCSFAWLKLFHRAQHDERKEHLQPDPSNYEEGSTARFTVSACTLPRKTGAALVVLCHEQPVVMHITPVHAALAVACTSVMCP